jgi:hypothetical protein
MKKLKFLYGGQPFRSTDFELLQQQNMSFVQKLFNSITAVSAIVSGLEYELPVLGVPGTEFTVAEGYIYDLTEICHVAEATFEFDGSSALYLRPVIVNSALRMVGGTLQNVMEELKYEVIYTDVFSEGDIALEGMGRINLAPRDQGYTQVAVVPLEADSVTTYGDGLFAFVGPGGERAIICYYTSSNIGSGVLLCTLPDVMCPAFSVNGLQNSSGSGLPVEINDAGEVTVLIREIDVPIILYLRYNVGILPVIRG